MRRLLSFFAAFFLSVLAVGSPDREWHALSALWKDYYAAVAKDKPLTQMDILSEIKTQAFSLREAWDFYDAGVKYVAAGVSINWKQRDSLKGAWASEVEEFDEPIVSFECASSLSEMQEIVSSFGLTDSKHEAFYHGTSRLAGQMGGKLADYISSDREYMLWGLMLRSYSAGHDSLAALVGDSYPNGAWLEYYDASRKADSKKDSLVALCRKYEGRGIWFYAAQSLLRLQKDSLDKAGAGSEAYAALSARCRAFLSLQAEIDGTEEGTIAEGAIGVKSLEEELREQTLSLEADEESIIVIFRNLPSARVDIIGEDDALISSLDVENMVRSFYVPDTVRISLPLMDDGTYTLSGKCGDATAETFYDRYSLSLASRVNSDGRGVYVADYKSGEPLSAASLSLKKGGKVLASADMSLGEGFTPLPAALSDALGSKGTFYLEASCSDGGHLRRSKELGINAGKAASSSSPSRFCKIFMDMGAYNPGDSAFVKVLFYDGDGAVFPEGQKVVLTLYDSEGNEIEDLSLLTDDFGAVAAGFALPKGLRGGRFSVKAKCGRTSGSKSFVVDEFILPSFNLEFIPLTEFYVPGDTIPLSGSIYSYSGHSLSSAKASYSVVSGGKVVENGPLYPSSDGDFTIEIGSDASKSSQTFAVTVHLSDGTGQTQEFSTSFGISSSVTVRLIHDNAAEGEAVLGDECEWNGGVSLLTEDKGSFTASVRNRSGETVPAELTWVLLSSLGDAAGLGRVSSGETFEVDFSGLRSGLYRLEAGVALKGRGDEPVEASKAVNILLLRPSDTALNAYIDHVFLSGPEEADTQVGVRLGSSTGRMWAVAELYGDDSKLLDTKTVYLPGDGKSTLGHSLTDVRFKYEDSYPDAIRMKLFYFRNGASESFDKVFRRVHKDFSLPLSFSSFEDRTSPATRYTFGISTLPGVQCLAAVFDKSSESIATNKWSAVSLSQPSVSSVSFSTACGQIGSFGGAVPILFAARSASVTAASVADEAEDYEISESGAEQIEDAGISLRSDFSTSLCFEPFLHSDDNGNISLSFSTSDKLSTYYVSLFAHDKSMRNAALRREMVVSIPVKVAVSEPQFMYVGDKWSLSATVSSTLEEPVSGSLTLSADDLAAQSVSVMLPAGGAEAYSFDVAVPDEAGELSIKLVFRDSQGIYSDGISFSVPVLPATQSLSESHSAVLLAGDDRAALTRELRESFVNVSGSDAVVKEISVLDMVREAIPANVEPASDNVLALTEAYYVRSVARQLGVETSSDLSDTELLSRILACQDSDGGFAWFESMGSSPVITAVVLEHFGKLAHVDRNAHDLLHGSLSSAAQYLDHYIIQDNLPTWCGGISLAQYLYVRSLWPSVPFEGIASDASSSSAEELADFKEAVSAYLVPSGKRSLGGEIFAKTRRLATLRALLSSPDGLALARSWGIKSSRKLTKSVDADIASLLEYAVEHKSGGVYYPNLVLQRGLLESEAYAHSMICDLLTGYAPEIADGIRLWLMLQKETQHWDSSPAFVDAISSILSASDDVLSTSILTLSKTLEKPFADILASGNGLTVTRSFQCETISDGGALSLVPIEAGTIMHVGDKITAVYTIRSEENRSFVRLHAPREAALRPLDQLSGRYGWSARPLKTGSNSASRSFTPHGYREVKSTGSEYYFDVIPEETSVVTEEFFVTQDGVFSAPVVTVECLYAPEYTANSSTFGQLTVVE